MTSVNGNSLKPLDREDFENKYQSACDCYPEHCTKEDEHGICWCSPEVIEVGANKIFIHQEDQ